MRLRETHNALQLPMFFFLFFFFFFSFFFQPHPGLRNSKWVFLILKILQYGKSRQWVPLFPSHPCKNWYKNYIFISIRSVITKFGKQVHLQDLTQMRLIKQMLVTSLWQDYVTNWNHFISTTRGTMATKLGRMITNFDGLLPIKLHDPSIT